MSQFTSKFVLLFALAFSAGPILASSSAPTATSLAISPGSVVSAGVPLTLTAFVSSPSAGPGFVMFCDMTKGSCETSLVLGAERSDIAVLGTVSAVRISPTQLSATLRVRLGAGPHNIKAVFLPTVLNLQSESAARVVTVTPDSVSSSTTTLAASGNAGVYTLSGTVTAFGNLPLTGTVNIKDVQSGFVQKSIPLGPSQWIFTAPLPISQEGYPMDPIAGDFNDDGTPDLVMVSTRGVISVYLGRGDGTFDKTSEYSIDADSYGVAVGDFDEDGNLDLVEFGGSVIAFIATFTGNGDGTFQPKAHFTLPWPVTKLAVGDFDSDGHADLVATGASSPVGVVSILLGNGDATFKSHTDFEAGETPEYIAIGDLNKDGKSDLVVAYSMAPQLSLYLGNGDGTFQPKTDYPTATASISVAVADINRDGAPDLVTNFDPTHVAVFLGNGDGTFSRSVSYPTDHPAMDIAVNDFDGDGTPDIAISQRGIAKIIVMHGNGDGTLQPYRTLPGTQSDWTMTVADFNGDGNSDIASPGYFPYLILGQVTASYGMSSVSLFGVGSHQVVGSYDEDALRHSSQSNSLTLLGSPGNTTLSLSSLQNPSPFGTPAVIHASFSTIAGVSPSGVASLMEGGAVLGSAVIQDASSTFTTSSLATGSHNLYVVYEGDSNYARVQSTTFIQLIDRASAALTLGSSENPAPFGTALTLIATTVRGATGTVTFSDDQTVLGTVPLNGGSAKLTLSNLTAGSHTIGATYSGDQNYK